MSLRTDDLIAAVTYSMQRKKFNHQLFTQLWQTLHAYWKFTCTDQVALITVEAEIDQRQALTDLMITRQQARRLRPAGIHTRFARQLRRLQNRQHRYHHLRRQVLHHHQLP